MRSSVRCGRDVCPPDPVRVTSRWSAAPVIGPSRRPTLPTSSVGSQCRPKIRLHVVEGAELDQRQRAAGHDLLGGLEEQPDPAAEQPLLVDPAEGDGGADQGGGVDVVAARVGDALDGAGPGVAGQVAHRQRVEVGPQRDHRALGADLGDQAGARQLGDPPAGLRDPRGHQGRRADLPPGELRGACAGRAGRRRARPRCR